MEILRLLGGSDFDQELRRVDIGSFLRNTIPGHADTGKHLVTHFPRIEPALVMAGPMRAGQG